MSESSVFELFPWINAGFIQRFVKNFDQNASVKSFDANLAFKSGENFTSHMVEVAVIYHDESEGVEKRKKFLLKIAVQTEDYDRICKECNIYEREIEVYTKVLPAVEKCFDSIGMSTQITPRCYYSDVQRRVLVFEDLREQQFKNVDSAHGLDVEHLKLSLAALAKWHAGTATLLLTNSKIFKWCKRPVDHESATMVVSFSKIIAKNVTDLIKNWPGYEEIAEKISKKVDIVTRTENPVEHGFNVLTHGDMFINNILFHHKNDEPIDIRLVDFQFGRHTTPEKDLVCLLYGSASSKIKQRDREHLIKYYHTELIKYLKLFNFPGILPTLYDIQLLIFRIDFHNAQLALFILGLRFVNRSYDGGFFEVLNDERVNSKKGSSKLYSHPKCVEQLKYLLDLFDRRGCFDF